MKPPLSPPTSGITTANDAEEAATATPDVSRNETNGSLLSRIAELVTPKRDQDGFEPAPPKKRGFELSGLLRKTGRDLSKARLREARLRYAQRNALQSCIVIGNCQANSLTNALQALCPTVIFNSAELSTAAFSQRFELRDKLFLRALAEYDRILVPMAQLPALARNLPALLPKVCCYPLIGFTAYHPDLVYINAGDVHGPLGQYNSAIALWGYLRGLSVVETVALFNARTYKALGYYDFWLPSYQSVVNEGEMAGVPLRDHIDRWSRQGCFMYSINHPKIHVLSDIAQKLLEKMQIPFVPEAAQYTVDEFAEGPVWPVYPEIGQHLGIGGNYRFKLQRGCTPLGRTVMTLDLREFIEGSFEAFGRYDRDQMRCERLQSGKFDTLIGIDVERTAASTSPADQKPRARRTPYTDLPSYQFWKGSVAMVPRQDVDPVVTSPFEITNQTKIATAGSCFAQNISAALQRHGLNYYVCEPGQGLSPEHVRRSQYGVYSARYGNIYTARQLLQLMQRAYGQFYQTDFAWQRANGRFVDPFRPSIEPDGWDSPEAIGIDMLWHLSKVRELFENLDVMIFTLGLTEAWRSKIDGAVFPLAPAVAAELVDSSQYEFVNFQVADVVTDLQQFLELLRAVNPKARMILTVSPVPLIATYEPQHALVATTYSKSVLRAAAGEICARNENCAYFPSYEIVTGNYTRGAYYESDLRTVTATGIEHVMRLFLKHYANVQPSEGVDRALLKELDDLKEIICDERAIES